ncbi:MAG: glycosyltransferase family 4 protein [Rhodospirillales bacterium]|nr:glycosyltransferase family 4 protein [Rhodospirillales bacterium]
MSALLSPATRGGTVRDRDVANPDTGRFPCRTLQIGIRWFSETAGGAARYYYHLVCALADMGVDVRGLVIGSDAAARETGGRVRAFSEDSVSFAARMRAARRAIEASVRDFAPHLITSHFALFAVPALDLIRDHPYVVHFHGPWAAESRAEGDSRFGVAYKRLIETLVYRRADRCIALSHAFARILVERYGVAEDRVRVVPGGVDASRFERTESRGDARDVLGWPRDRPIILAVRRLTQRMGLGNLIEAMIEVRRRVPEALLLIAGKGALRASLESQVTALGLQQHVRFLGFVPDASLPLAYRAADIVVMPTRELEGFGLTAVEALAAGTPVLVTPIGGLPEVVRQFDDRLILEGLSPEHIASGVARAFVSPSCLPTAGACADFARRTYDWPIIARAVHNVYHELA